MLTYQLSKQWLEQERPDLLRALNPRLYQDADCWESPAVPAVHLGGTIAARTDNTVIAPHGEDDTITLYICVTAAQLIEFDVPTYFVERALATAVAQAEPPEEAWRTDIHLPFPAGIFMLPPGMIVSADGYEYNYVTWCQVGAGQRIDIPGVEPLLFDNDILIVSSSSISDPKFSGLVKAIGSPSKRQAGLGRTTEVKLTANLTDAEQSAINTLAHLARVLLRVLNAYPELHTSHRHSKRVSKDGGSSKEIWMPHILGSNYSLPKAKESRAKRIIKKLGIMLR